MTDKHRLGDLQLAIMRVLWRRGEAAATEVHAALEEERGLAPTTIATMLRKMEDKGVVTHRTEGRRFVYRPTVEETAVRRTMVGELTDRLFRGEVTALVSHLLDEHPIDAGELERLRALVAEHEERAGEAPSSAAAESSPEPRRPEPSRQEPSRQEPSREER